MQTAICVSLWIPHPVDRSHSCCQSYFYQGIWTYKQQQYVEAFQQVGQQLGQLHAHTEDGTGPVLDKSERQKAVSKTAVLEGHADQETITTAKNIFKKSSDIVTPYAITYGDRSPHNIIFNGRKISQIDSSCKKRSIAYEHRGVVVGVKLMARRLPYSSASMGNTLANAYWDGYEQESQTERENCAYLIRQIYGALKILSTYKSPSTLESKLTQWTDVPILVNEIEKTVSKINNLDNL